MNKLKFYLFALLLSGFLSGCKSHSTGYTKVIIFTSAPLKSKLYISDIPFSDEKKMIVDSAIIINNRDSIILYVPDKVERLYSIDVKGLRLGIIFINDAPVIRVHANYFSNKYYFTGSKASLSLKKFEDKQLVKAIELRSAKRSIDSLKALHVNKQFLTSAVTRFNTGLQDFYKQYINYADTVSSPAAFMKVYNKVDFGDDYKASKKFILRAEARFPHYQPLQDYAKEVLATIRIYELEFMVGDELPSITLPDQDDKPFTTGSLSKQYYLIDFWSTWCDQCMAFKAAEKKIADKIPPGKLQIVSVAIDNKKSNWKNIIYGNQYNWIQLIDVKMWQGPAVRTLVFDSIPFNFLVAPRGKIINKAIKPDSLLKIISRLKLN